jgi:hypothetical protein
MELYHDLCIEIDIITIRIKNLEDEELYWKKVAMKSKPPYTPLDNCLMRIDEIRGKIWEYSELLHEKERAKKAIEQCMSEFETLESKVAYLRDVKGMTLAEVAAHLNFSYSWIKKISMKTTTKKRKKGTWKELTG